MSSRPRRVAAQAAETKRQSSSVQKSATRPTKLTTASSGGKPNAGASQTRQTGTTLGSVVEQHGLDAEATGGGEVSAVGDGAKRKSRAKRTIASVVGVPALNGVDTDGETAAGPAAKRAKRVRPRSTPSQLPQLSNGPQAQALPAKSEPQSPIQPASSLLPAEGPATLLPPTLSFSLPTAIAHLSRADPRFANMFTHVPIKPFAPPLEAIDPFRTLVTSIIGQQVSWMAARAINGRFRALFGYGVKKEPGVKVEGADVVGDGDGEGEGDEDKGGYPTPREVVAKEVLELKSVGLSLRKAEYVRSLAEHFCSGALTTKLLQDGTDEDVSKALIAVRGIGQWTVDMFLMFSLRRPDVLPVGDLGVQKGLLRWFLAAHGALPVSTKGAAAGKGKAKGKAKGEDGVKSEDGVSSGKKGGKAAEAARKKYAPAPTPTPAKVTAAAAHVKEEPSDETELGLSNGGGRDRGRMVTLPRTATGWCEDGGGAELDTLIVTPRPIDWAGGGADQRPVENLERNGLGERAMGNGASAGKVRNALPPTPLTPGNTAHADTPDSDTASAPSSGVHTKQGVLHAPITPAASVVRALPRLPPTPVSPGPSRSRSINRAALPPPPSHRTAPLGHAVGDEKGSAGKEGDAQVIPDETLEIPSSALPPPSVSAALPGLSTPHATASTAMQSTDPPPSGDQLLHPPSAEQLSRMGDGAVWDPHAAAPLEGLGVDVLKARLGGKKVKGGAYLTPQEMERMTEHWKPYRSLGVYYMWPAGEEF